MVKSNNRFQKKLHFSPLACCLGIWIIRIHH